MNKKTFLEKYSFEQQNELNSRCATEIERKAVSLGVKMRGGFLELTNFLGNCQDGWARFISFEVDSVNWGDSVTLNITLYPEPTAPKGITAKAELSWSSTGRSVSQSIDAIDRYTTMVKMAAFLESMF